MAKVNSFISNNENFSSNKSNQKIPLNDENKLIYNINEMSNSSHISNLSNTFSFNQKSNRIIKNSMNRKRSSRNFGNSFYRKLVKFPRKEYLTISFFEKKYSNNCFFNQKEFISKLEKINKNSDLLEKRRNFKHQNDEIMDLYKI